MLSESAQDPFEMVKVQLPPHELAMWEYLSEIGGGEAEADQIAQHIICHLQQLSGLQDRPFANEECRHIAQPDHPLYSSLGENVKCGYVGEIAQAILIKISQTMPDLAERHAIDCETQ